MRRLINCKNIHFFQKAISDKVSVVDFVHVKGNPAASHISGERSFYGKAGRLKVETMTFNDIVFILILRN